MGAYTGVFGKCRQMQHSQSVSDSVVKAGILKSGQIFRATHMKLESFEGQENHAFLAIATVSTVGVGLARSDVIFY